MKYVADYRSSRFRSATGRVQSAAARGSIPAGPWTALIESVSRRASMCCSCAMMSPKVTLPEKEGGADVNGAKRDGAEQEGGAAESDYRDRSWALLRLTVA